jgi:hypothetical protein
MAKAKPKRGAGARRSGRARNPKDTPQPQERTATSLRDVLQLPAKSTVREAIPKLARMKTDAQSAAGVISDYIGDLVDKKHFDRFALRQIRAFHALAKGENLKKFAIAWVHFMHMAEALEFAKLADLQPDMLGMEPADKKPGAEGGEGGEGGEDEGEDNGGQTNLLTMTPRRTPEAAGAA